jgi:invasion protein IalB
LAAGWIGLYQMGVPVWTPSATVQSGGTDKAKADEDARRIAEAKAAADAEAKRRADEAEAKRRADEAEQQRLAAKAEKERADAEAKRRSDEAERKRVPAVPAKKDGQPQQIPLVYSDWVKLCGKNPQDADAKELCQTMKEAHLESGQFVAAAALIERAGESKKILQLILPNSLLMPPGTRVTVDSNPPSDGPFIICKPEFCMAQHEVTDDFVRKLKAGQTLQIQAIDEQRQPVSYLMPLAGFSKAYDGPPTDPKVLEEQRKAAQKKMQEELLKRGEEAEKKLRSKQSTTK